MMPLDCTLLANGGTGLLGEAIFLVINWPIACIEGLLLCRVFGVRGARVYWLMVAANYLSGLVVLVGAIPCLMLFERNVSPDWFFYHVRAVILGMIVMTWVVTLILEWPFCLAALRGKSGRLGKSILATFLAQTATYILVAPLIYHVVWQTDFALARVTSDPQVVSSAPDIATIYYLSPKDNELRRVRLNGTDDRAVMPLPQGNDRSNSELYLKRAAGDPALWDLQLDSSVLIEDLAGRGGLVCFDSDGKPEPFYPWSMATVEGQKTPYRAGGIMGRYGVKREDTDEYILRLGLMFHERVYWRFGNPSLLPGDLMVCELGERVVLVDLPGRRIGMIAHGIQPVVVLDESALPPETQPAGASPAGMTNPELPNDD